MIKNKIITFIILMLSFSISCCWADYANQTSQPFVLPPLPFENTALEPHMSANTFSYHHAKHHGAYVTNLNNLIANSDEYKGKTLEEIIIASSKDSSKASVFNNAAQIWNHSFFWHSLSPKGGGSPKGKLLEKINQQFGDFDKFKQIFKETGMGQFGSGWVWLVAEGDELKIVKTSNADLPLVHNQKALLTCDVWEHAYYLDHQNRRADFISVFLENLANWEFAEENFR